MPVLGLLLSLLLVAASQDASPVYPQAEITSSRLQVIVHDGDQNKVGGDSGEACVLFCAGGSCPTEGCDTHTTGTGGNCGSSDGCPDGGFPRCPEGTLICGAGGIDPSQCPANTLCANGCCLPHVD